MMWARRYSGETPPDSRPTVQPFPEPIYVTRPLLPPLQALTAQLVEVWESQWLTNAGKKQEALERRLRDYLAVPHISLFNNGTTALLVAIKALGLTGEVVTTPFTFPATPHAIHWSGLGVVFADIDPVTMNLSPAAIEAAITPRTSAILPASMSSERRATARPSAISRGAITCG